MGNKIFAILLLTGIMCAGFSVTLSIGALAMIASLIYLSLVIIYDEAHCLYAVLCMSLFASVLGHLAGYSVTVLIYPIVIFKLISNQNQLNIGGGLLLCSILVFGLTFVHEALYASSSLGVSLDRTFRVILMFLFLTKLDIRKLDLKFGITLFILSLMALQYFAFATTNGIEGLSDDSVSTFRLGEGDSTSDTGNYFDGAMGFPIQTMLIFTFSLRIIIDKTINRAIRICLLVVNIFLLILTFFTTSRVYLLGLATAAVVLLFSLKNKAYRWIAIFVVFIGYIFISYYSSYTDLIIYRFSQRMDFASDTRTLIWGSCLNYLFSDPLALLFGEGPTGYVQHASLSNRLIEMSAHNTLIDGIMGYGLLGMVSIIMWCVVCGKRIKTYQNSTASAISAAPLITWVMMSMTNSSFILEKTYFIIPFLVIAMFGEQNNLKTTYND